MAAELDVELEKQVGQVLHAVLVALEQLLRLVRVRVRSGLGLGFAMLPKAEGGQVAAWLGLWGS